MLPLGPVPGTCQNASAHCYLSISISRKLLIEVTVFLVCETNTDVLLERFAFFNQKKKKIKGDWVLKGH